MPPDFKMPDDFPDLTIPERTTKGPEPIVPWHRPSPAAWQEGARVLAPWEPEFLYVGRIMQILDNQALIQFDDGDAGWVLVDHIRPLILQPGLKLLSRRRMSQFFFPAQIVEVSGDEVLLAFDDGQADEWASIAGLRIPCQPLGPGAAPTTVASHRAFVKHFQAGDRVWAPWQSATLFVGTIDRTEGQEAHIHFDDGDRGWVLLEQLVPLQIPVGLRVMGRWKRGTAFFPGTVTDVQGDRIHIQYDDGDKEWTTPAALAIVCQPFGPDARPTKTAWRWQSGWLGPLVVVALLMLLRFTGCR